MSFGKELQEKRKAAGYRYRRAFAKAADVSYSRVTEIELEASYVKMDTLAASTIIKLGLTAKWDMNDMAKALLPYINWRDHGIPRG